MSSIRCWPLLALFLPLLSGCYRDETMEGTLEELGGASLEVELTSATGLLRLGSYTVKGESKCLKFPGGRAFLDGKELERVEVGGGGWFYIPGLGGSGGCKEPTWRFDPPAATEGVSEFEVADGTGRLLYGVSALAMQRTVRYLDPLPGPVPGGPVMLEWSPATDQLDITVSLDGVGLQLSSEIAIQDGRIGFLLPSTVSPGRHTLTLDPRVRPGTAHCEPDPARCFSWRRDGLVPDRPTISIIVQ